jgi:hypothetical protein
MRKYVFVQWNVVESVSAFPSNVPVYNAKTLVAVKLIANCPHPDEIASLAFNSGFSVLAAQAHHRGRSQRSCLRKSSQHPLRERRCVTGKITNHREKPEIIAIDPKQIVEQK